MNNAGFNQYKKAKPRLHRRPDVIIGTWVASFLSLGLLYFMGTIVSSVMASFRSCKDNADTLYLVSCGKSGLNLGDLVLITLFLLSAALTMTLFTAALRMVRGRK